MERAGGSIDAIQDLMVPVTLAVIERDNGIRIMTSYYESCTKR